MNAQQLTEALQASTEPVRKYVLGPMYDANLSGDFDVSDEGVAVLVGLADQAGRLASLRFRMYEYELIKAALGL